MKEEMLVDSYIFKGKTSNSNVVKQRTLNEMLKYWELEIKNMCKCLYDNALPFNLVKSHFFQTNIEIGR